MFGSVGLSELVVILAVALLVIGPRKLPELARNLGRGMREFRRAVSDVERSLDLEEDFVEGAKGLDPEVEKSRVPESPPGPAAGEAKGGGPEAGGAASPAPSPKGGEGGGRPA